jgi:transcriptional repressor NrdR
MKCPFCSTDDTKVIDSRLNQTSDITRRRRQCPRCEGRFTTYERVEEVMPMIIKKDGRREPYFRDKILGGIKKACQKREVPLQKIEECVGGIERKLQSYGLKEVPAKTLGQMIMQELHKLDKVAYVRFASVYREFRDVDEFVAELQEPQPLPQDGTTPLFAFAKEEDKSAEQAASEQPGLFASKNPSPTESKSS